MTLNLLANSGGGGGAAIAQLGILLLIPLAMYFLMIRPQRRKTKDQQAPAVRPPGRRRDHDDLRACTASSPASTRTIASGWRSTRTSRSASTGRPSRARSTPAARLPRPGLSRRSPPRRRPANGERRQRRRRPHPRRRGMIRRRLWTSLLGIVGVAVVGLALNLGLRQHAGPRTRPAGRRVRRPHADRGRDGGRPRRHP